MNLEEIRDLLRVIINLKNINYELKESLKVSESYETELDRQLDNLTCCISKFIKDEDKRKYIVNFILNLPHLSENYENHDLDIDYNLDYLLYYLKS